MKPWKKALLDNSHELTRKIFHEIELMDNVTDSYFINTLKRIDSTVRTYIWNEKLNKEINDETG